MTGTSIAAIKLPFIGRESFVATLTRAIETGKPAIVFLEGVAGIGKTFLLDEAERLAHDQGVLCPPIADFYDTRVHSDQGLQAAIADALDPNPEGAFRTYRQRRRGAPGDELWPEFLDGYRTAVGDRRVVLRFDTAERLVYERDSREVLLDCEVEESDAPSWNWLLRRTGELPDTMALIAARPTPAGLLLDRLQAAYGDRLLHLKVEGFSLDETQTYFRATEFGCQVADESPEMVEKVHLLSDGRPILIALALDWLARGMWDPQLYSADVIELRRWKGRAEEDQQSEETKRRWDEITRRFEMRLVEQIRNLASPLDVAVRYVALCRKGSNVELLARLMGIGLEEAGGLVEQLLTLSFVKPPRPGSHGIFFLHDEMHDLVESHIWLVDWPDYAEQKRLEGVIIGWYTEQIEALDERIRQAQGGEARWQLRREQQLLITERLYYQFDEDPRLGYREYSHLNEEAIARRELEWDTWLRNEALWFMSHRAWRRGQQASTDVNYPRRDPAWVQGDKMVRNPTVDYDSRRRWVNRYIARNDMAKASHVADQLLVREASPDEPELYRGGVRVALATAQAYMGGTYTEQAVQNFDVGIRTLLGVPLEHREPWLHPYLLGTAYLYKGLALRGALSLDEAAEAYAKAIRRFRQIDYRPGLAESANNLAYVLARQGRLEPALRMGNRAWRIRQELGDEYGIGLSFNTRGIIHERMDHPITAIHNSERARGIFLEIGDERGIILAQISLGRAYRRKARSLEWGQQNEDFEQAEKYLQQAISLQGRQGPSADMFYRVEALNELGCLYRDWVATLYEHRPTSNAIATYLDKAEQNLLQAIELTSHVPAEGFAPLIVQYIDTLEDLTRVCYWRVRLNLPSQDGDSAVMMHELLERAERLAREHLEGREELRLVLGKVYFQRARLAQLEAQAAEKVAEFYGLAAGYAESYSVDAPEVRKFAGDASDWLSELNPEQAEECVWAMRNKLHRHRLRSTRLRENIESIVRPMLDVSWPTE